MVGNTMAKDNNNSEMTRRASWNSICCCGQSDHIYIQKPDPVEEAPHNMDRLPSFGPNLVAQPTEKGKSFAEWQPADKPRTGQDIKEQIVYLEAWPDDELPTSDKEGKWSCRFDNQQYGPYPEKITVKTMSDAFMRQSNDTQIHLEAALSTISETAQSTMEVEAILDDKQAFKRRLLLQHHRHQVKIRVIQLRPRLEPQLRKLLLDWADVEPILDKVRLEVLSLCRAPHLYHRCSHLYY